MLVYWKNRKLRHALTVAIVVILSGCARHYSGDAVGDPYGFFGGIWHGMIFPITLFVNLFSWLLSLFGTSLLSDIEIIGRPNTGIFFYYIGFAAGLSAYIGCGTN
jgi:hypothetical protein